MAHHRNQTDGEPMRYREATSDSLRHKAAERAFVDAQSLRQLGLRDRLAPSQIADSVKQRSRKTFFLNQSILQRYIVDCIIPDVTCKVKPVAFLQQKPVPTPMG